MSHSDVYVEVVRQKVHLFISIPESSSIVELKKTVAGILKVPADEQVLKHRKSPSEDWRDLENSQSLAESGITSSIATAQNPAQIALFLPKEDTVVEIDPLSSPPPIPDAMRPEATQPATDAN